MKSQTLSAQKNNIDTSSIIQQTANFYFFSQICIVNTQPTVFMSHNSFQQLEPRKCSNPCIWKSISTKKVNSNLLKKTEISQKYWKVPLLGGSYEKPKGFEL